jgi:hypothetical protein
VTHLFFSYSHRDESLRDELEVHLAQLKNEGIIETWHDRRITAGDEFDNSISEHLERADVILLLVSPYFLASRYCYQVEMTRALERHDAGEARVIPVILHPCDWKTAPFAKLQAATRDGMPVSKYPNQHDAFLEIAQAIRAIANRREATSSPKASARPATGSRRGPPSAEQRSSNLRVKKEFTDQDRDNYLEESYEFVANFFEGSLVELQARNPDIAGKFRRITANHFTAGIYRQGNRLSACGVRLASSFGHKQIVFSYDPDATNSMNESFDVDDDGHTLFLRSAGFSRFAAGRGDGNDQLTQQGAAEALWALLMEPLQR